MESLAVLVATLFITAIFAGPLAILISSTRIKDLLDSKAGFFWMVLKIVRKVVHLLAITLGFMVGTQLIGLAVSAGKLIGISAVITSYIALRREYFPDFHLLATISHKLGIRKVAPGEHGPSFKWKKNGRSSGNDGHGPGGQH